MNNVGLSKQTVEADAEAGVVNAVTSIPEEGIFRPEEIPGASTRRALEAASRWIEGDRSAMSADEKAGTNPGTPEGEKGVGIVKLTENQVREIIRLSYESGSAPDLSGRDLSGLGLYKASLSGTDLSEADLTEINLSMADLRHANLSGATMNQAMLQGVDLRGANLRRANLFAAGLRGANLQGADLREAYLGEADLTHADLAGADLQGARYNSYTSWSVDFDPRAAGAILELSS